MNTPLISLCCNAPVVETRPDSYHAYICQWCKCPCDVLEDEDALNDEDYCPHIVGFTGGNQ